ncbi:hypothetical protein M6B38_195785 [Iris pallida]|uniref:Uncharacterized protein n=1 Tax=Iris pallida TaxID=29817 RepID=A0AAX6ECK1_IRIPA|nr:hypothetical protein M6B38_195785 [Iris pallida]
MSFPISYHLLDFFDIYFPPNCGFFVFFQNIFTQGSPRMVWTSSCAPSNCGNSFLSFFIYLSFFVVSACTAA